MQNPTREEIKNILANAKVIAVYGLSPDPSKTSHWVSKIMQDNGYRIIPVNSISNVSEILGEKVYKYLKDIPFKIDIVNVYRRSEHLQDVALEFLTIDCDVFWAQLGLVNEKAYELLKQNNKIVVMDRCIKVEHSLTKS
ncbi:MAG: CoA-binding protein [Bacillales bacterium]|nr:CoA-binding protein [Bacillales bacterium]